MHIGFIVRRGDYATLGSFANTIEYHIYDHLARDADLDDSWWDTIYSDAFKEVKYLSVAPDMTLDQLRDLIIKKAGGKAKERESKPIKVGESSFIIRTDGISSIRLLDSASGQELKGDETLSASGLADGDIVELSVRLSTSAAYCMIYTLRPEKLFKEMLRNELPITDPLPYIWGALLYTDEDADLATYIRKHFNELNHMSGPRFHVFVLEKPKNSRDAIKYWKQHLDPKLFQMLGNLRWLSTRPYDKANVYELAHQLGIAPAQIPCLALFTFSPEDPTVVIPITDSSPRYFRRLFSAVQEVVTIPSNSPLGLYPDSVESDMSMLYFHNLPANEQKNRTRDIYRQIISRVNFASREDSISNSGSGSVDLSLVGPIVIVSREGVRMEENYTFKGQTTFINKPQGTVISDFQNLYESDLARSQPEVLSRLEELLELLLSSKEVIDEDKEAGVAKLHEIANEVRKTEPNRSTLQSALLSIKGIVSKATDIAVPALSIVAALLTILSLT